MQAVQGNLFTRDDTFFGVCEGIGQDLGIHANWLRLGFALTLFFSPVAAIGGYAAAGAIVALTRWLAPVPVSTAAAGGAEVETALAGDNDTAPELAKAA